MTDRRAPLKIPGMAMLALGLSLSGGCVSVSYTETGGGDAGADASDCIELAVDGGQTRITNGCDAAVNFIEFSTGSSGLVVVPPNDAVTQNEIVSAWGACIAPALPRRTGDFDYYCENP